MTKPNRSTVIKVAGSFLLLGLLVFFLSRSGQPFSWHEVFDSAKRVGFGAFLLALFFVALQTGFQILRLWFLLPNSQYLTLGRVAYAFSFGQFLNTFVPARAGDVVKMMLVTDAKAGSTLAQSAGVVVADKLVDLLSLVIMVLCTGAFQYTTHSQSPAGSIGLAIAGFVAVMALFLTVRTTLYRRFPTLGRFEVGIRCLAIPERSIPSLLCSAGSWATEAVAIGVLVGAVGISLSFSQALFCLFVLNLAIAFPISVANVGTFEASLVYALNHFGLGLSEAVAIAGLHHILQCAGISLWALCTWMTMRMNEGSLKRQFRVESHNKQKAIDYYSNMAPSYDHAVNKGVMRGLRARERAAILELASLKAPARTMIDVGCGNGYYALAAKKEGLIVTAVDASQKMVDNLRTQVDAVAVVDVDTLAMTEVFDRVVCAGVMDFVAKPETAFANLARLVAPGGLLVILSPRAGVGGWYYRMEKKAFGIPVNLYNLNWYRSQADQNDLDLADHAYPLPTNMAVAFRKRCHSTFTNKGP